MSFFSDNERLQETSGFLSDRLPEKPSVAIVLGSGLGSLVDHIKKPLTISYEDIPHWGRSTAAGHSGTLVFGYLESQPVIAMAGRFHRYEGWTVEQIGFPIQVLSALGPQSLIVSNAAGGLNPKYAVGDIVVIHNHIDLMYGKPTRPVDCGNQSPPICGGWPLRGRSPYDADLCAKALQTARVNDFAAYPGTYLATLGPTYETRAEYRMMRKIGADVVGMSTVPEVQEAQRIGMRVLALSMVSNLARPDAPLVASHEEVLDAGRIAEPKMRAIVCEMLHQF